jgi:parvulin-like peptidyl-prolyl isomerase
MTAAVFGGPENRWLGPFQSDFGHHLIRVVGRTMARIPTFAEAEARVRESYAAEKRAAANEAAYREIRERYEVVVDWPAGGDAG